MQNDTEGRERVVEQFLVDFGIEITDEQIGTNVQILLMCRCLEQRERETCCRTIRIKAITDLVHTDRFAVEFNHVHDFDGIVSIFFREKLNETVALVIHSHTIFGLMNID